MPLLKSTKSDFGGSLKGAKKKKRPLFTSHTMHVVLRSSKAQGKMSFQKHQKEISSILERFSKKYYVEIVSYATLANHIHLQIKLFHRHFYNPFIRAITAAIMMKVTGFSRWCKKPKDFQFWDLRPFSRVAQSFKEFLNLKDYILLNQFEAKGLERWQARHNLRQLRRTTNNKSRIPSILQ